MDILIDLIIALIRQTTSSASPSNRPQTLQQRQQATLAQQVQAMQQTMAQQQARARQQQAAGRGQPAPSQASARAAGAPAVRRPASAASTDIRPSRPKTLDARRRDWRIPFLLGEVLSQPVALRDEEM